MKSKEPVFELVVGNIGTVYSGNNIMVAEQKFFSYVKDSKANYGRAAGEPVVLFHRGQIRREYQGTNPQD